MIPSVANRTVMPFQGGLPAPVILIADDEPLVVSALSREARRCGMASVSDTTSLRVIELARQHRPAVIILDIHQHLDGRDILAALKKDPETRGCKVVVLSGVEDASTRDTCLQLGAEAYELKPFDTGFMSRIAQMAGCCHEALSLSARHARSERIAAP